MLLLAPCQSTMRSGWPASAARTAAVTGAHLGRVGDQQLELA